MKNVYSCELGGKSIKVLSFVETEGYPHLSIVIAEGEEEKEVRIEFTEHAGLRCVIWEDPNDDISHAISLD